MITTERLTLRPFSLEDAPDIHAYAGDPEISMMMFYPKDTLDDTRLFVEQSVSEWDKDEPEDMEYVILLEGRIIGGVNLERYPDGETYEIGWILHRDYRGRGYAAEAARALLFYAFDTLKARRVQAHCDSRNAASVNVMQAIGMTLVDGTGTRCYPKTGITAGEYLFAVDRETSPAPGT